MTTSELRNAFLDYFAGHGHLLVPSSSLVPYRDPSVLLTTAGMQQFKPYFLGQAEPPARRLTSVQKCFRTTDIDRVGLTGRHCTFFEMLGNFSVGDYFKETAIHYAYHLSVNGFELDPGRIWVTVFQGDDEVERDEEAMAHWEATGIPRERTVALPRSENFWGPPGPTGPCGPCSELYYDRGPESGCRDPDCRPGCECDRYFEYWNLVFMQYNMDEHRQLKPLPSKNIDTGLGLERMAALKQNVHSVFLTDVFRPLIDLGEELSHQRFGESEPVDVALRVMADHGRAMTFLVADGVLPSNEGRGYVLRRIIRRAARFSRNAGMEPPVLGRFAAQTIETLGGVYPELVERRGSILRVVNSEEDRFNRTLDQGVVLLEQEVERALEAGSGVFPGAVAFLLHDTYGFPIEVTRELVEEKGLLVDLTCFEEAMEKQRQRARRSLRGSDAEHEAVLRVSRESEHPTEFVGYEKDEIYTVVERVEELSDGRLVLSLRESPFYAEAGGQASDTGWIESETGRAQVLDVQQHGAVQVIIAQPLEGAIRAGTRAKAMIATGHRHSMAANHTGTHLLHYALRYVLGKEVTQAGSAVRADKFRFDFAYHEPLGTERLAEVEEIVNRKIVEDHPVRSFTTSLEHARDLGAIALFGEKYGDFVRVVEIDDFSRELCGGTHVHSTSEIGVFKVLSESSVGANLRRIEALTGHKAVEYYRQQDRLLAQASAAAGVQPDRLVYAIQKLVERVQTLERELDESLSGRAQEVIRELIAQARITRGVNVAVASVPARSMEQLLGLVDQVRSKLAPAVIALGAEVNGKALLVTSVSEGVTGIHAGELVKQAARILGGGGGGSPTLGRGAGDARRLAQGLAAVKDAVERSLDG